MQMSVLSSLNLLLISVLAQQASNSSTQAAVSSNCVSYSGELIYCYNFLFLRGRFYDFRKRSLFISLELSVLACPWPMKPSRSCVSHNWRLLWQAVPDLFPYLNGQYGAISAKTAGPGNLVLTGETWAMQWSSGGTWSFFLAVSKLWKELLWPPGFLHW